MPIDSNVNHTYNRVNFHKIEHKLHLIYKNQPKSLIVITNI